MTRIVSAPVSIQTSADSVLSPPSWFGELTLLASHLSRHGVLTRLHKRVRFARRRFGRYEVVDFLAVLFGYAISGERTLEAFVERLQPFAVQFMAQVSPRPIARPFDPLTLFSGTHRVTR